MEILSFLLSLFIAFIIGVVAEQLSPFDMPGGWAGAIVAGFIGAWLGEQLFGSWGPVVLGVPFIPALIGAILFVVGVGLLLKAIRK